MLARGLLPKFSCCGNVYRHNGFPAAHSGGRAPQDFLLMERNVGCIDILSVLHQGEGTMKYEPMNDDFFGKKLPRGGFTIIEDGNHKYSILVNKDSPLPPGEDESSPQLKARLEPIGDARRPR